MVSKGKEWVSSGEPERMGPQGRQERVGENVTYEKSGKPLAVRSNSGLEHEFEDFLVVIDVNALVCDEKIESNCLMSFSHGEQGSRNPIQNNEPI